jgi:hypothetical protein
MAEHELDSLGMYGFLNHFLHDARYTLDQNNLGAAEIHLESFAQIIDVQRKSGKLNIRELAELNTRHDELIKELREKRTGSVDQRTIVQPQAPNNEKSKRMRP